MNQPPVIILCAGEGTRMSPSGSWTQKALYPLGKKSLVSHIMDQFPASSRFVLATGFRSEDVENFCHLRYGNQRHIEFVKVSALSGPGTGPGRSTLECLKGIDEPFFLVCCDTLWAEEIPRKSNENWIGTGRISPAEASRYCMVKEENGSVLELLDKPKEFTSLEVAFNGLIFIRSVSKFKKGLEEAVEKGWDVQISHGLKPLVDERSLKSHPMPTWCDVGTEEAYLGEKVRRGEWASEKVSEFFFHEGDLIIKAFQDEARAAQRAIRAQTMSGLVPHPVRKAGKFISYKYHQGDMFSKTIDAVEVAKFLRWCDVNLWLPIGVPPERTIRAARKFYYEETQQRIRQFAAARYNLDDQHRLEKNFSKLPWDKIVSIKPIQFHGDLQTENIIVKPDSSYLLIDWRENFGGEVEFGDIYYDLAKLHASLSVDFNHLMLLGLRNSVLPLRENALDLCVPIEEFCERRQLDYHKVLLLERLVFLRMSALHQGPLQQVLWDHAVEGLNELSKKHRVA